jgi:hypothetical protein
MKSFLHELRQRNRLLYVIGWTCLIGALVCGVLTQVTETRVLGINAFIKPMNFFLSICIFTWTMGWYLFYLDMPRRTKAYSIMLVIVFAYEMLVIVWQAANGRLSHFNIDTPLYGILFSFMGLAIMLLWVWTLVIMIFFFRKKQFTIPSAYLWGIRLGLFVFLVFTLEGGAMSSRLSHTVSAADGSAGLPVVNWSTQYGDLRVAHFFGMHALQIIPLFGFFIAKKPRSVQIFSGVYLLVVLALFVQAMKGVPLFF